MLPELSTKEELRKSKRTVKWQKREFEVAEAIASRDHNNLYITSLFFKDPAKYKAFCTYYAVMRIVDDRVDNLPLPVSRSEELYNRELEVVNAWEQVVISCHQGIYPTASQREACDFPEAEAVCKSLNAAFRAFPIPMKPWTSFFEAMRSDLVASEFTCWSDFLAYAEGATVAPTTIYLSLITARSDVTKDSCEFPTGFNLYDCGRYLGIFAYLGHIIRDLAEDITQPARRLCIAREDMVVHGVSSETLKIEALRRQASPATRSLVAELLHRARRHLAQGQALAAPVYGSLESDGRFILELIITMYERIVSKIESIGCDPMAKRHHLTQREKTEIVNQVAARVDFSLPNWATI